MACSRFCPSRTRPSSSSLMASPVSRHSPRRMAAVMASMRRRVILRFVPPRSSHSWASSGVMVTISRFRSGPRVGDGGCLPLGCAWVRVGDVRAVVGLRVVGTERLLSLYEAITVPEPREDAETNDATMRGSRGPFPRRHVDAHARRTDAVGVLNILRVTPAVTLLATDKIIGNCSAVFPLGTPTLIRRYLFVIDQYMRTSTLNS